MDSNFMFIDRLLFELLCKNPETQKHGNTETHTDSDEYSIVAFCKNATIINILSICLTICCEWHACSSDCLNKY